MLSIHFAPLQGYTEAPYRNFHATAFGGVDIYHAPFVRIERGDFRRKELRDIAPERNSVPHLVPQLLASEPDEFRRIADSIIDNGYQEIDINMGCPFLPIVGKRKGSGILSHPDMAKSMLETVYQYPDVQFSVKMRLGWASAEESMALLPLLNQLPLSQITVHPRIGKQQYKGSVDMKGFEDFYNECSHAIIYNGDIATADDIHRLLSSYPRLSGVMIGRGLLANPALALEFKEQQKLTEDEMKKRIGDLHHGVYEYYRTHLEGGEAQIVNKMKSFWEYLCPEADRKFKKAIKKSTKLSAYEEAIYTLFF